MSLIHDLTNRLLKPSMSHSLETTPAPTLDSTASLRGWLWVDGVGGYLVCVGDVLSIGQPVANTTVDIPLLGDLSRQHAQLVRDGDGYLFRALRTARAAERPSNQEMLVSDGRTIELGSGVQLRFTRPHRLSCSARLDFISGHGTLPHSDAVLLWADTLVLGPQPGAHVVCPGWQREVVLFRQGERLVCRVAGEFVIDGQPCQDRGAMTIRSRVVGSDFSFSFEAA